MKKRIPPFFFLFFAFFYSIYAQIPSGYYNTTNGKKGRELQIALNQIINNHRSISYAEVWYYYQYTDLKQNKKIWDIYSDQPNGAPSYEFEYRKDQCVSTGSSEGKCYSREHSFCQSWFGHTQDAPYTDIFHVYPVDGWINSKRGDAAYGQVSNPTHTFTNGSKFGPNTYLGATGNCFEPIHAYKGDIARTFFYMATRYMFEDGSFKPDAPMTNKSQLKPWALNMLLEWHLLDPVSEKEIERNNKIYAIQKNRNPFIDHPEWVFKIWGNDSVNPVQITPLPTPERPYISWFSLTDSRTIKMTFSKPMVTWTTENPLNFKIGETVSITSLHTQNDTLIIHLGGLFSQNVTYNLSIENLLGQNMAFLKDTVVSFYYPYQIEQKPLIAWTFDNLSAAPSTSRRISADYHLLDTVSSATLFCNGFYQSGDFLCTTNNTTELDAFQGTILGDPRPNPKEGNAIAFCNASANGKSVVFKFPTKGYFNLTLSMAVRRTKSGFDTHSWEWSLNGEKYFGIDNSSTCPLIIGEYVLTTLDLRDIDEINDQFNIFLRLTLDGANGPTGNNRFDNITLHGVSIDFNSINDRKKREKFFTIAPNPNQGKFQILHNGISDYIDSEFVLFSALGQTIRKGRVSNPFIDISEQPNGIYFLKMAQECLKVIKY